MTQSVHDDGAADLQALMDALRLDPADLAELVGMHRSTPYKWLSGAVEPPAWLLVHLRILCELRAIYAARFLPDRLRHLDHALANRSSPDGNNSEESVPNGIRKPPTLEPMAEQLSAMTPEAFKAALLAIEWRQADFARHVGCDDKTASRWAKGHNAIPQWVAVHLELLQQIQGLRRFVQPNRERKARGGP